MPDFVNRFAYLFVAFFIFSSSSLLCEGVYERNNSNVLLFNYDVGSSVEHLKPARINRTKVIWMVPSWECKASNHIDLEEYGIRYNKEQKFVGGKEFAIFYEHSFGKVPYFEDKRPNNPINGGLPQLGDLNAHLNEAKKNILETIPDENFDGIAVIDFEEFRPTWELSWGPFEVYKQESIRLVRQQYPFWSRRLIEKQARKDYETAAKSFFLETIRLGKSLRPNAKWGYYIFPKCNGNVGENQEYECSEKFKNFNDEMKWLWIESTAFFPSVYLYPKNKDTPRYNFAVTGATILESQRIRRLYCPTCEIHIFTKIEYDSYHKPEEFYSKQNLASTVYISARMNAASVVVWSTSKNINKRCGLIKNYVSDTFGPYVQLVNRNMDKCRAERCSSNGECYLRRPMRNAPMYNFRCRCDFPFRGDDCSYGGRKYLNDKNRKLYYDSERRDYYNSPSQFYHFAK